MVPEWSHGPRTFGAATTGCGRVSTSEWIKSGTKPRARLRTIVACFVFGAGWNVGLGTDGSLCFGVLLGGVGPCTRRSDDGGGLRRISSVNERQNTKV